MGAALLVSRLLVGLFVAAGFGELADLSGFRQAVVEFGVRVRLAGVVESRIENWRNPRTFCARR
jgi:hypothetical protein